MTSETAKLIYKKLLTADLGIFRFQPSDNSKVDDFKAGQFVNLGVKEDQKITYRAYSMSSSPLEKTFYEFYIRHKEYPTEGKFTTHLFKMSLNESVFWQKPRGAFTLEEIKPNGSLESRIIILVASGTGLAPFISQILYLKKTGSKQKITLLHGARYPQELGYREELERLSAQSNENWNFSYLPTISRPEEPLAKDWRGNKGRVETILKGIETHDCILEKNLGFKISPENSIFYLCGYKNMIDNVISILSPLGFVDNRKKRKDGSFDIKYELYGI